MATRRGVDADAHRATQSVPENPPQQTERVANRQNLLYVSVSKIDIGKVKPKACNIEDIVDVIWRSNKGNSLYASGAKGSSGEFEKLGFLHSRSVKDEVLAQLGFNRKRTINQIVTFYLRKYGHNEYEMFAVTNNHSARGFAGRYADSTFPGNVARRILNLEAMIPLAGVSTKFEDPTVPNPPRQPRAKYTATLRDNASILNLDCFQNQKVTVTVEDRFIGFDQRIPVEDVERIVDHLAVISRGEDTYTYGAGRETGQIEADTPESNNRNGLIKVDRDARKLYKKLGKLVYYGFLTAKEYGYCNLGYKDGEELARGSSFQLRWQGDDSPETIMAWDRCPSLIDVITAIGDWKTYKCEFAADVDTLSSIEARRKQKKTRKDASHPRFGLDRFIEWFANISLSFENGLTTENKSLLHFINGAVTRHRKLYWHLNNQWFQVEDEYLALIHFQFKELLTANLIPKGNNEHSKIVHPYSGLSGDSEYVRKYENDKDFIVGDQGTVVDNVRMFDLLYYDEEKDKIFLYHIKEGFECSERNVCSQMAASAQIIARNLRLPNFRKSVEFKAFCRKIASSYKATLPKICGKAKAFRKALASAHFVYAVADTELTLKSFFDEMKSKTKLDPKDLEDELGQYNSKSFLKSLHRGLGCGESLVQVSEALISKLKESGYADPRSGNITSKLIHLKEEDFLEESMGWLSDDKATLKTDKLSALRSVFAAICELYCTYYDDTMAKFDLLRARLKVEEFGFQFRICEIQM